MPKARRHGRMTFDAAWIGTRLFPGGGFDHLGKTLGLEPHAHNGFELTYISEGETVWVLEEGAELRLVGGAAALIQPGMIHHGKHQVITPSRLFWLVVAPDATHGAGFTATELAEIGAELSRAGNRVWRADDGLRQSFELFRDALAAKCAAAGHGALPRALCRAASCQLLASAVRALNSASGAPPDTSLFEEAQRLMRENLARSLSVANIAARLGVSAAFFSARFKAESGMTPGDYLRRLRCERACELLADTRLTVTETAFRLGFSTSQHFAGVFRRYVGVSPRQFRRGA